MNEQIKFILKYITNVVCFILLSSGTFLRAQQSITMDKQNNQTEGIVAQIDGLVLSFGKTGEIFNSSSFKQCIPFASNLSASQNYISTKTFKIPFVFTDEDVNQSGRSTCDVNQTVQYFDGLGRPLQTISVQGSPGFRDLVLPVAYDMYGREQYKYLPYVSSLSASDGSFKNGAITAQRAFYDNPAGSGAAGVATITGSAFAETRYEPSPFNRVLEQGAPGASWQLNAGHTKKITYGSNALNEVRMWTVTPNGADGNAYYPLARLYKTVSKDENWIPGDLKSGTVEEFKDLNGKVVLKRTYNTGEVAHSTYYVYDELGNLRYVLPPAVNENGQSSLISFTEADNAFKQFIYGYHYDARKRVIEKQIPGKGWEELVYNKLDQLVMSRDAEQRDKHKWLFTKYDAYGRTVLTGIIDSSKDRAGWQTDFNIQAGSLLPLWEMRDNSNTSATGTGYSNIALPAHNMVETYLSVNYFDDYDFYGNDSTYAATTVISNMTKSLATGSKVNVLGSSIILLTVSYYDPEGRVIETIGDNYLGGKDRVINTWSFAGELDASTRTHIANGTTTIIASRYEYDHVGRKLATKKSINGQPEVVLSKLTYNEIGQLLKEELHSTDNGGSFLQNNEYAYNERGWLKSQISGQFSLELKYDTTVNGVREQYNGNIANQLYTNGYNNVFNYQYDHLNRLIMANATGMTEILSYDLMGNISSLSRDGGAAGIYNYTGNRLDQIVNGPLATGMYAYDLNGNATIDGRNGMSLMYNILNLPTTVTSTGVSIAYTYSADGSKLKKLSNGVMRYYLDGIEYADSTIDFVKTEEGIARNNGGLYSYEYNQTDHLGNVRLSFYSNPSTGVLDILQRDDYYAFGQRQAVGITGTNKYLYNGKELQEELGQLDYGARFYDPVIGRWNVVDPLAEKFDFVTPYNYAVNNPGNVIDPDGRESINLTGEDAEQWVRAEQSRKRGGPGDGKKNNRGYFPSLYENFVKLDPFANGEIGRTWSNWLSSESTLGKDVWSSVSNTFWGVASLTNANTYMNWYQGQKEYWSSSAEDRGKVDGTYLASFVGETAKYGPLGETRVLGALASLKSGYGLKLGDVDLLYANPEAEGMTIFSYKNSGGKAFRLDYHKVPIKTNDGVRSKTPRTLHYHTNFFGQSIKQHRSLNPWTFGKPIK
jgi:RHS repeat-associated protein